MSENKKVLDRRKVIKFILVGGAAVGVSIFGVSEVMRSLKNAMSASSTTSQITSTPGASTSSSKPPTTSKSTTKSTSPATTSSTTSATSSTQASSDTVTQNTSSGSTSAPGVNNVPWSNLRGVCYVWQTIVFSPDGPNGPDPSVGFPLMRNNGFNLARFDDVGCWGLIDQNPSAYLQNVDYLASQADASGVSLIIQSAFGDAAQQPLELRTINGVTSSANFYNNWWNNVDYQSAGGTNPAYFGMTMWEAGFTATWKRIIPVLEKHPSVIAYSLHNEPQSFPAASNQSGILKSYYTYMSQQIRALGSSKLISIEGTQTGQSPNVSSVLPSSYGPFVYDIHYPTAANLQTMFNNCQSLGITGWMGENFPSNIETLLSQLKQYGFPSTAYRFTESDSDSYSMLTSSGQPKSSTATLASRESQTLGAAEFFV
ncbi:MAG TPA: cellulase family glycosylhydrolase [Nitrososphaerales archaeon]|nr:cellulase family glycosylhydrolase [Nitrososphaerales archaeon]